MAAYQVILTIRAGNEVNLTTNAGSTVLLSINPSVTYTGGGTGAEVNVQSDWNQTDNTQDDFIKNKPTIPAAQVNSDWNATTGVAEILNKPTITPPPANTDSLTEGSTNLYFTTSRVLGTILTGISFATNAAITATDTILQAFGKLQAQISALITSVAGKQDTLVSGTNIKTINGSSVLGSGDLVVGGSSLGIDEHITFNSVTHLDFTYYQNFKIDTVTATAGLTATLAYASGTAYVLGASITSGSTMRLSVNALGGVRLQGTLL